MKKSGCRGVRYTDNERCELSYIECLKKQNINLKENAKEMKIQAKRNLSGLFSSEHPERLKPQLRPFQLLHFSNSDSSIMIPKKYIK